jgi:excinuclease UvrABC helicase subunit UvrB
MTRNLRKAVSNAINDLDWNLISDFCTDNTQRPKNFISFVKKEMKTSIFAAVQDMIEAGLSEISITYFTITIKGDENQHVVTILFTPTKSVALEDPEAGTAEEIRTEIAVLEDMMNKAASEENFELAATLRDRIKKLAK